MLKIDVFTCKSTLRIENAEILMYKIAKLVDQSKVTILSKLSGMSGRCVWPSVSMSNTISSEH